MPKYLGNIKAGVVELLDSQVFVYSDEYVNAIGLLLRCDLIKRKWMHLNRRKHYYQNICLP